MTSRPPMSVRKLRYLLHPLSSSYPWSWFCRICTANDFHPSWDQAMQEAETHWGTHWIKGKPGPMTLGDVIG